MCVMVVCWQVLLETIMRDHIDRISGGGKV
jgi:hypothetical protein